MTREEAIAFFRDMNECTYGNLEAVEMAIKALEQDPTTKNNLGVDCIDRQAAITFVCKNTKEILKDTMPLEIKLSSDYIYENVAKIMRNSKVLPPVTPQEPRWIPVSERLPKAGEYVGDVEKYYLVQNEYGDMLVARYTHSGYWEQIYQLKPYTDEIVAWMPLPQQYEPQESEVNND